MSISPSLSYRSCAAAFPTGYGPRGDAFAVDHKWATSTLLIVTLKVILTLVQRLLLVQVIRLYTDLNHLVSSDVMAHGWVC